MRPDYAEYLAGYKRVVNQRFEAMVQKLWKELNLSALPEAINRLPEAPVPPGLEPAVQRWQILKDLKDKLWCAIRHDTSRQQIICEKDFYHSLCSWLAVGEVKNGAFECFTWQQTAPENKALALEVGRRRLPDMDAETWRSGHSDRDDWWELAFCKSCVIKVGDGYIDSIHKFIAENSRA